MDILVSNAYLSGMFARVLTMLAILAITVVTTIGAGSCRTDGRNAVGPRGASGCDDARVR